MTSRKTQLIWTEGISEKHSQIGDLDINNHSKFMQVMENPRKLILCGLKEYQKRIKRRHTTLRKENAFCEAKKKNKIKNLKLKI